MLCHGFNVSIRLTYLFFCCLYPSFRVYPRPGTLDAGRMSMFTLQGLAPCWAASQQTQLGGNEYSFWEWDHFDNLNYSMQMFYSWFLQVVLSYLTVQCTWPMWASWASCSDCDWVVTGAKAVQKISAILEAGRWFFFFQLLLSNFHRNEGGHTPVVVSRFAF